MFPDALKARAAASQLGSLWLVFVMGAACTESSSPNIQDAASSTEAGTCTYDPAVGATPGCVKGTPADCGDNQPSYSSEVSGIISNYCVPCHRAGGLAPDKPLDSYKRVFALRTTELVRVSSCVMPPACAPQPTADEHATLVRWFVCGAPNN
jgi:hypothetical protein